jgi:hypothetical protein
MNLRRLSQIAGASYLIIFFTAIFANFFVLESLLEAPLDTVREDQMMVRLGILAFLITAIFDVVVAWALFEMFQKNPLTRLSTYFRLMHAGIMGVAVFALPSVLSSDTGAEILGQIEVFNTIWLIGLFFFGVHLILLGKILKKPGLIAFFLILAGIMYMLDTAANFLLPDYESFASIFLALVALPSVIGEMSLAIWLLAKGGRDRTEAEGQ